MPKTKRAKTVHLTETRKKTKSEKGVLIEKIRDCCLGYEYAIFLGKNKVMAKALGNTQTDSLKENMYLLGQRLCGNNVGLMFSNVVPEEFSRYCKSLSHVDYARAGGVATETVVVPSGPVTRNDEPLSHTLESQLRNSGMPVLLKKGVLYLDADFQICEQGDVLTSDQAKLLKIFFKQMAEFKVCPVAYCKDGSVVDVADDKLSVD